ncbi:MAG: hypothetical protein ACLS36_01195 [Streptococcus sp.]
MKQRNMVRLFTLRQTRDFQETTEFDLENWLNVSRASLLNKGLRISITDKREGLEQEKHYHYEGGITSYVKYINENKDVIFDEPISLMVRWMVFRLKLLCNTRLAIMKR